MRIFEECNLTVGKASSTLHVFWLVVVYKVTKICVRSTISWKIEKLLLLKLLRLLSRFLAFWCYIPHLAENSGKGGSCPFCLSSSGAGWILPTRFLAMTIHFNVIIHFFHLGEKKSIRRETNSTSIFSYYPSRKVEWLIYECLFRLRNKVKSLLKITANVYGLLCSL